MRITQLNPNDLLGLYNRYSVGQRFLDPGTALVWGSAISGGSSILGGALGGMSKEDKAKPALTLSLKQREMNNLLFDFLMGVKRDGRGQEISRDPLLTKLFNRPQPQYRVAPLTSDQKGVLGQARNLMANKGSVSRPDQQYLSQLRQGILPTDSKFQNPRQMAKGGKVPPGETVVVGEKGQELVKVLPQGGIEVIPNKETVATKKKLAAAMANAKRQEKKTGLRHLATGTPQYRKLGDHYVPYEAPSFESIRGHESEPWYQEFTNQFTPYWQGQDRSSDPWGSAMYNRFTGTGGPGYEALGPYWAPDAANIGGRIEYGGDWQNVANRFHADNASYGGHDYHPNAYESWVKGDVGDSLNDWWNSLETADSNPAVDKMFAELPGTASEQYDYLKMNTDWLSPDNTFVLQNGQLTVQNPFEVDQGNLQSALNEYADYYNAEGGPGYSPSAPGDEGYVEPNDWGGVLNQLTPEQYQAFNAFNNDYADVNIGYNPQTGQYDFVGDNRDQYFTGVNDTVKRFLEQQTNQNTALSGLNTGDSANTISQTDPNASPTVNTPVTLTAADLVQDAQGNWVPDPTKYEQVNGQWQAKEQPVEVGSDAYLKQISDSLGQYATAFDPTKAKETFKTAYADPAYENFEENTRPGIRESFAGGNLFGSSREKAETKAIDNLEDNLTADRAEYLYNAEQDHQNRALTANSLMMNLAQLPESIMGQKASNDYKKASAASIFHNMELQSALVDAELTNQELAILTGFMGLFGTEQQQQNAEWTAAMQNVLSADGGLNLMSVLGLTMGTPYQDQSQTAYI